jgi:hypothetical protein
MLGRVHRVGEWFERKQDASELSRPLTYCGVGRYLFWQGAPALAGPLVIVAYQFLASGTAALVTFGVGVLLFTLAVFGAVARLRDRPIEAAAFAVAWLGVAAGAGLWSANRGLQGIGALIVGFFGFTSLVAAAAVSVGLKNQLRED